MNLDNVKINLLMAMCKLADCKIAKQEFLVKIAQRLAAEDYTSLDDSLCLDLQNTVQVIFNHETARLLELVYQRLYLKNQEGSGLAQKRPSTSSDTAVEEDSHQTISTSSNTTVEEDSQQRSSASSNITVEESSHQENEVEEEEEEEIRRYSNILILNNRDIYNNKFRIKSTVTSFKFKNVPSDITILPGFLKKAFDEILSYITRNALPHYKIGMKISLPNFNATKPVAIPFTDVGQLKSDAIASILDSVAQSNSNFLLTDILEISSVVLHIPHGKGRFNIKNTPSSKVIKYKTKSIIDVNTGDPIYCLPIAVLLGKCVADGELTKLKYYKSNTDKLLEDVHSLNNKANVKTSSHFGTHIIQLALYQRVLSEYNIIVFENKESYKDKMFCGNIKEKKMINIFYFKDIKHFVALKNVRTFFEMRFQCELCLDLFNFKNYHICERKCSSCEIAPPCTRSTEVEKLKCDTCNRYFYGEHCYNNHKAFVCSILKFCISCSKLFDMRKRNLQEHNCDEKLCTICTKIVDKNHQCYVQTYKQKTPANFSIIFYDIECTQNINISNDTYLHEPNLCIAHIVCNKCFMISQTDYSCPECITRKHIFENSEEESCISKFVDFCELYRKNSSTIYCIAHNFKGYDGQFILKELIKRKKSVRPIIGGMKIFKVIYDRNKIFIDSLNFLPMSLSKFPETFGLENLTKGWYPHFFNTLENYNYIGDVPNEKYFGLSHMTDKEINQFNVWYTKRLSSGVQYNNRNELIKYCNQDVDILRKGCIAFMVNFSSITGVNPLLESFTLAQAVMLAYRKKFLQSNTLGIVPNNLYHHPNKNQSLIGLKWLIHENKKSNGKIVFEVNLPTTKFYVDGFCKETNTVYEFLGCYWHGCEKCFLNRSQNLNGTNNLTFESKYEQTYLRFEHITSLGYNLTTIWECVFREYLNKNPQISKSIDESPELLYSYLNPRDALYGGRTEAFQLYYKIKPGEKIRYYDFTSLYPYVNKTGKNPIHHPKIYYKDECKKIDITKMDGLIKCNILPPQDLLIPVLPAKINGKLLFTLCRKCAELTNITTVCSHNKSERILTGTWVLDEVKLALTNGYKIHEIIEVWEYEISQYNENEKTGGVFTEYMNCFLKLKQEASDWPPNVSSEVEKQSYISEFFHHEGIQLEREQITYNPSQRGCSKLALNALWGKFIQRNDRGQTEIIHTPSELYSLISSPGVVLIDVIPLDDVLWVNWKYISEHFLNPLKHVSLAIGAFTTANARIKLYNELAKISHNILYCDTDSIFFVENASNEGVIKTGNFIGDLTDELTSYGPNSYITEFVSTGPKCYAYTVLDPINNQCYETAKCKGITLNTKSKNILNFSTLKSMVIDEEDEGFRVVFDKNKIKRRKMLTVVTTPELKSFSFTEVKRIGIDDYKSKPFGYSKPS